MMRLNGSSVLAGVAITVLLTACGGGGGGGGGGGATPPPDETAAGDRSVAARTVVIATGDADCPNGGVLVETGIDENGNGVLDSSEVDASEKVCHGRDGSNGADGTNGANGQNALVNIVDIVAGAACPAGGIQVDSGLDANSDGVLDGAEVSQSRTVCHGVNGSDGADGVDGTDGANGSDGLNSLLAFSDEVAGANCPYGGLRIDSGLDSNGNNILESGEVTQTQFVCSFLSGDFGWQMAELIETDNAGGASSPQIAVDPSGNAVAVWMQWDGTRTNIWSNRYVAGVGWETAQLIENSVDAVYPPQIAVDAAGNAIAVWSQWDGAQYNVWTNRYVAGSGWGVAGLIETIDAGAGQLPSPKVAVDSSGNAIAVWSQWDGVRSNIMVNHYISGIGWNAAQLIEANNTGGAVSPQIAFDSSGNAIVVWSQSDGTRNNIWSNRYVVGSGWGAAQLIESDNTGTAYDPQIAVDPSGNAVVVWSQLGNVWSNRYVAGGAWGTPELIEASNLSAFSPQIVVDASGNAVAVWVQFDGLWNSIWSNRYVAGSGWGTAELIESNDAGSANSPQLAVDASGNVLAVWSQQNSPRWDEELFMYVGREDIWSNRYVPGSGWGTARLIENDNAGSAYYPQIAVDGSGNGIAVWAQSDGTRENIHANRWVAP